MSEDNIPKLSLEEKAKLFDLIATEGNIYCIWWNMNDVFGYACAEYEGMDDYDLDRMSPLMLEYGHDALVAYAAVKKKSTPIDCKCNHKNENYYKAIKLVRALRLDDKYFMSD